MLNFTVPNDKLEAERMSNFSHNPPPKLRINRFSLLEIPNGELVRVNKVLDI